jgi:hypothetical protein
MRPVALLAALVVVAAPTAEGARPAQRTAPKTVAAVAAVSTLALTGRHAAFAVDAAAPVCPHVDLWLADTGSRVRFASTLPACAEVTSTGQGIASVGLARTRVLWISYGGGNIREWSLWTATPTRRAPRQLRFVARDVDARAPIVLGPGTAEGVPYAVDRQVVYLGEDGRRIFTTTVTSPVRAIAAGQGGRVRVAALLADGSHVGFDRTGRAVSEGGDAAASAIRVSGLGVAVQAGSSVRLAGGSVVLPRGATMVDVAQGRILWTRAGDLGTTAIPSGRSVRLVDGTPVRPALGQLEANGLAWSRGRVVRYRGGRLP